MRTEALSVFGLEPPVVIVLCLVVVALLADTVVRGIRRLRSDDEAIVERWRSVGSWWALTLLAGAALAVGRSGVFAVMGVLALLALRELLNLLKIPHLYLLAVLPVPLVYGWAWLDWETVYLDVLPGTMVVLFLLGIDWRRPPYPRRGAVRSLGHGWILGLFAPLYLAGVASLPASGNPRGGAMGWVLYLLLLTAFNDILQAWWGRKIGSRLLAPVLSPHKTWEGLIGGLLTTVGVALVLGPALTPLGHAVPLGGRALGAPWLWSAATGALIALAGVIGDLTISAFKRKARVKDSGTLLPGQGGILDRLDSLTATAPVFFFLTYLLWYRFS